MVKLLNLPSGAKFCSPVSESCPLAGLPLPFRFFIIVEIKLGLVLITRLLQLTRLLHITWMPPAKVNMVLVQTQNEYKATLLYIIASV